MESHVDVPALAPGPHRRPVSFEALMIFGAHRVWRRTVRGERMC